MSKNKKSAWWDESYGFFGDFYMEGDNSKDGYLTEKTQNLNQRTNAEVKGIVKLTGLNPSASILDIPCGYGRHSIKLAKRGFLVTGSDINTCHLEFAKKEAKKNSAKVKFVKENMLDIDYDEKFDVVVNMFYSFGFFEKEKDNFKVLQNFFNALKPGGKFLMHTDVNIPRILNGKYKHDETRKLKSGNKLRIIDNYNPVTKRIDGAWILIDKNGNEQRKDYSVRVYTKDEFVKLCKRAGFKFCEVFSDWSGKPYNVESEDMLVVATK